MAITVLPGVDRIRDDNLAGEAIKTGLQSLAQHKMQQMQQRHNAHGLSALGIPHAEAGAISMLPQDLQKIVLKNYLASAENAGLDQALGGLNGQQQMQQQTQQQGPEGQPQEQEGQLARQLKNPRLKPEHRIKIEALKQRRDLVRQGETAKETLPVYKDIAKGYKAAKESEKTLDRMEKLIASGKLSDPEYHGFLKALSKGIGGFGIDLHSWENPESQEFQKLSNNFVKNAKDIFGGRLTDTDLKAFMQTVPTLSNSDEGKQRIINVLRTENKAAFLKKKALNEIIKANGGIRPPNLELLIDEAVGDQLDALSKEFIESNPDNRSGIRKAFDYLAD